MSPRRPPTAGEFRAPSKLAKDEGDKGFTDKGILWDTVDHYLDYGAAVGKLRTDLAWWVFRGSGKKKLFQTWKALPADQKAALDYVVGQVVGKPSVTLYRWPKGTDEAHGRSGLSLSGKRLEGQEPFTVRTKDIMLHYDMPDLDDLLKSKMYGHEREVILKPTARIASILRVADRWLATRDLS